MRFVESNHAGILSPGLRALEGWQRENTAKSGNPVQRRLITDQQHSS
jgi:hypothetical protein